MRRLAERTGAVVRAIPVRSDTGALDWAVFEAMPLERIKIAALTQMSNVTGLSPDLPSLCARLRRESGAMILVDGAQGAFHCPETPEQLDWDLYCFSGHKVGAPGGTGVLCVRPKLMTDLEPVAYSGGMVYDVTEDAALSYDDVRQFEAGSPDTAGAVGLAGFPSIRVLGGGQGCGCLWLPITPEDIRAFLRATEKIVRMMEAVKA